MYSSLDRIDIVSKDQSGRDNYHQTDHRSAEEIEAEPEVSVLFALTRMLMPLRMVKPGEAPPLVRYVAFAMPPLFLREAIASAGAQLDVEMTASAYQGPRHDPFDLADRAFKELADRVRLKHNAPAIDLALLHKLEKEILEEPLNKEDDEITYWTRIVELAAVTGELLRPMIDGRWAHDENNMSTMPFAFTGQGGSFNVVGKAERFIEHGKLQSPSQLLLAAQDGNVDRASAKRLITFKPSSWRDSGLVFKPLLEKFDEAPLIVLGDDLPNTFAMMKRDDLSDAELQFEQALANLRDVEVDVELLDLKMFKMLVVTGSYFAAEKILDSELMKSFEVRLGAPLLAAGIPHKGVLLVTSALDPEAMAGFIGVVQGSFNDPKGEQQISPVPFLVSEGKVQGMIQLGPPEAKKPERKGFWGKLFGREKN